MHASHRDAWALILAGGDGARLRELTRQITGEARPGSTSPSTLPWSVISRPPGAPELWAAFDPLRRTVGSTREASAAEHVYAGLPEVNFSERVLAPAARQLGVVRVKGLQWSDLGSVERLVATIRRTGRRPRWLDQVPVRAAG